MIYVAYNTENIIFISSVKAVKKSWCLNNTKEVTIFDDITAFYSNLAKKKENIICKNMFMATISLRLYKLYHPKFTAIIKQKYDLFIVLVFYDGFARTKKMCK